MPSAFPSSPSALSLVLRSAALALALLSACGGGDDSASNSPSGPGGGGSPGGGQGGSGAQAGQGAGGGGGAAQPSTLKVDPVSWNPNSVATGKVAALIEQEGRVILFGDAGVVVITGGAQAAIDASIKEWKTAAVLPAADGQGSWVVGLDGKGKLHRLVDYTSVEPISSRYGLDNDEVAAMTAVGEAGAAFALAKGLAVADGKQVQRLDVGALTRLTTRDKLLAGAGPDGVVLFDLGSGQGQRFALPGARAVTFDDAGRLLVAAGNGLQGQRAAKMDGDLYPIADLGAPVTDVAAEGLRVWFVAGGELGLDVAGALSRTSGLGLPAEASLTTSAGGDVWTVAGGEAKRFALGSSSPDEKAWQEAILPVFARTCSKCHLPGGTGGRDLSTYASWAERRAQIQSRVVTEKSMPPAGNPMDDADRAAVGAWCSSTK